MKEILALCKELEDTVQAAYENGVSLNDAERLAARMLAVQMRIATQLATTDLDSRMKKNGLKAVKAVAYMNEIAKHDKKPAEAFLENAVNLDAIVNKEADAYEKADAEKDALTSFLGVFKDAHIYFRTVSKGGFSG